MTWETATDVKGKIYRLLQSGQFLHVRIEQLYCFRSYKSKSRAIARIWSLPKIWQMALAIPPAYCIEVISEHFDRLDDDEKNRVLIHELMHIPKTFSGALLAHRHRYRKINTKTVDNIFKLIFK